MGGDRGGWDIGLGARIVSCPQPLIAAAGPQDLAI